MPRITTTALIGVAALSCALIARSSGGDEAKAAPVQYEHSLLVQLAVEDLDRAIDFYTNTLNLTLEARNDDIAWARIATGIPNVTIGLGTKQGATPGDSVSINLGVKDIDAARATLESRGVTFLGPTIRIPGVVVLADLKDPDGHKIRLAAHPEGFGTP